jgi:hypothetical protein
MGGRDPYKNYLVKWMWGLEPEKPVLCVCVCVLMYISVCVYVCVFKKLNKSPRGTSLWRVLVMGGGDSYKNDLVKWMWGLEPQNPVYVCVFCMCVCVCDHVYISMCVCVCICIHLIYI